VNRFYQWLLIVSVLLSAWLLTQAVHEAGHVLAAWLTGGQVRNVALHPLSISRTDLEHNPHPAIVVWSGPIVGALAPLLAWGAIAAARLPAAFVARFIAGFALVANGCYLAFGSFWGAGDAGEMLALGSPHWTLWLFGALTITPGIWLWHGQGQYFGLGQTPLPIERRVAWSTLALLALLLLIGSLVGD
jgi:hypothetical protein